MIHSPLTINSLYCDRGGPSVPCSEGGRCLLSCGEEVCLMHLSLAEKKLVSALLLKGEL